MSVENQHLNSVKKNIEAGMEQPLPGKLPDYRTLDALISSRTRHVAAIDGTDQNLFTLKYNPEQGIAVWGVLYVEASMDNPSSEIYKEGARGTWFSEDLFYYHLTLQLPNQNENRRFRNDFHSIRQTLSASRPTEPPIFKPPSPKYSGVRTLAAVERANGEWQSLRSAITHQLGPGDLILKDGRFGCQIEQSASWVDQMGRDATRNEVRCIAIVKSGTLYSRLVNTIRAISLQTQRPFYFIIPPEIIEDAYANDNYQDRKTLMVGGKDHTDLAGVGGLWTAFCPDPINYESFVIIEFNLYDMKYYRPLAEIPKSLRQWHIEELKGDFQPVSKSRTKIHVTDLKVDYDEDISSLVEPTLQEILWLCEREVAHFGYPNLLGLAHRDVVLTKEKIERLRSTYRQVLCESDSLLRELVNNSLDHTSHKLHNIS